MRLRNGPALFSLQALEVFTAAPCVLLRLAAVILLLASALPHPLQGLKPVWSLLDANGVAYEYPVIYHRLNPGLEESAGPRRCRAELCAQLRNFDSTRPLYGIADNLLALGTISFEVVGMNYNLFPLMPDKGMY